MADDRNATSKVFPWTSWFYPGGESDLQLDFGDKDNPIQDTVALSIGSNTGSATAGSEAPGAPTTPTYNNPYGGSSGRVGSGTTGADIANNLPQAAKSAWMAANDDFDRQMQIYDWADDSAKKNAEMQKRAAKQKGASDWYGGNLNLQSAVDSLISAMGNSLNGSGLYDLADITARADDLRDVNVINTDKDNLNNINFTLDQTLSQNQDARNRLISDHISNLGDILRNLAGQTNGYVPEDFSDYIDENGNFNWDSGSLDWFDSSLLDPNNYENYHQYEPKFTEAKPVRNDNASDNAYNMLRNQVSKMTTSTTDSYQQRLRDERTRR